MAIQTRCKTTHQIERQYNGRHQSNRIIYQYYRAIRSIVRSHTRLSVIIYCLQPIPVCYNRYIQTKERSLCIK